MDEHILIQIVGRDKAVSLVFIVPDQLAFTDLYATVCLLLNFHHLARRYTMRRNGTKLLVTRSIEAG